jgi:hypothetical protein
VGTSSASACAGSLPKELSRKSPDDPRHTRTSSGSPDLRGLAPETCPPNEGLGPIWTIIDGEPNGPAFQASFECSGIPHHANESRPCKMPSCGQTAPSLRAHVAHLNYETTYLPSCRRAGQGSTIVIGVRPKTGPFLSTPGHSCGGFAPRTLQGSHMMIQAQERCGGYGDGGAGERPTECAPRELICFSGAANPPVRRIPV